MEKAAENGNADAQYRTGLNYEQGRGVEQSVNTAVRWYKKAAEQEDPDGQYHLALAYQSGAGDLRVSERQAAIFFQKAAIQGHSDAQIELAKCYFKGKGVTKNYRAAWDWFRRSGK